MRFVKVIFLLMLLLAWPQWTAAQDWVRGADPMQGTGDLGTPAGKVLTVQGGVGGSPVPTNTSQVGGATAAGGGVAGSHGVGGLQGDNATPAGNPFPIAGRVWTEGAQTAPSGGNVATAIVDPNRRIAVTTDHPRRIRCTVTVSTATTIQAVGGSCVAPGTGLSIYITDILFASNAQGIAADAFPTLKYGTGGTCGTGTTVFWGAFLAAATQATAIQSLRTPIKIPENNEVCWINTTAGSKFLVLSGYIAP